MNIDQKLRTIIAKLTPAVSAESINENTILTDDLGFDSVNIVEMIVELENEFDFEFEDDELGPENLTVYKNLHELIVRKTNG